MEVATVETKSAIALKNHLPYSIQGDFSSHPHCFHFPINTTRDGYRKASTMVVPPLIPLLTLASFFSFLGVPSSANDSNVLLTGDVLGADEQLSYGAATFVMQRDCNLVHYVEGRRVFQSYTRGYGVNCTLSLTDCGQLVITSSLGGSTVWRSPFPPPRGQQGEVRGRWMHTLPAVKNVLFSSEMLDENAKLVTRDYGLLMKDDCNLVLVKASVGVIWQSGTAGRGLHCFLRLDHRRQIAVVSDDYYYKILWSSNNASSIGDHALLLQINGQAVVYGPMVWLTTSSGTTLSSSPLITASSPQTPFDATFSSAPHSPIAT
ncbi:hypothetical protein B296_00011137 [Ensete ventricosum]|uniref:Bulb-type lectin domain-containing protein n=1 Tax=Ensete ventricosum TaxID=4639 RepID=A0A427AFT2_ENSVE|nr:hypothetical protein B296_00011137 [Ensete ventricosum]